MMRQWGFKGVAGLVILSLASASCATILGIDKDYHPFVYEGGEGSGVGGTSSSATGGGGDAGCTCVPLTPTGWNGPVALYAGDPASMPTACPSTHPIQVYQGNSGLLSTPASCTVCKCSTLTVTCVAAPLLFETTACSTQIASVMQPPPGACQPIAPPGTTKAVRASAPTATGACVASGGQAVLPPPAWQIAALACAGGSLGTGCGAQATCATKSEAPFEPGLCVFRSGDQQCPDAFTVKYTFTDNVNDSRGCVPCECFANAQCSATTSVYTSSDCSGASLDVVNNGFCVNFAGAASIRLSVNESGSCMPTGGEPIGDLTEGDQTTVCCLP